jgi:hypothetical protein
MATLQTDQIAIASKLCGAALSVAITKLVRFLDPAERALQFFQDRRSPWFITSVEHQLFHRQQPLQERIDALQHVVNTLLTHVGMLKKRGSKLSSEPSWDTIQLVHSSIQSIVFNQLPNDTPECVDSLATEKKLRRTLGALDTYLSDIEVQLGALIPSTLYKQWLPITSGVLLVAGVTTLVVVHGPKAYNMATQASESLHAFATEHVFDPVTRHHNAILLPSFVLTLLLSSYLSCCPLTLSCCSVTPPVLQHLRRALSPSEDAHSRPGCIERRTR